MATFPALVPSSRTYTPGDYPNTVLSTYSGKQTRVLHSNVNVGTALTLEFIGLSAADLTSIINHYYGQQGGFTSFALPSAVFSGVTDPAIFTLSGYQWIYAESPQVEDLCGPLYNVSISLEMVSYAGAAAGGQLFDASTLFTKGLATVSQTAAGKTFTAGAAYSEGTTPATQLQATASAAYGVANGGVKSVDLQASASLTAGTASGTTVATSQTAVLFYTGNASTKTVTGAGFAPGFVAIRFRGSWDHAWFDNVRGATYWVDAGIALAEQTTANSLTSFDSDGFTLGNYNVTNNNTSSYLAWCLPTAASTTSNTNGTVTTNVRASQGAEFSAFAYVGSGNTNQTIGHGLSGAPDLVIIKQQTASTAPYVGGPAIGNNYYLSLGSTSATPTSSTSVYRSFNATTIDVGATLQGDGTGYRGWAFKAKSGTSSSGTFTGGGIATHTVSLGYQPKVLLLKNITTTTGNWVFCYRPSGGTGYVTTLALNNSTAEAVSTTIQFTSDGFSVDVTGPGNVSGGTTQALYWAMK